MSRLSVDPDALDATAARVKEATAAVDGMRLDLLGRTTGLASAVGTSASAALAQDLLAVSDRLFSAARDELAAMSMFASQAGASYRQADAALTAPTPGPRR